jgi:hypothetical protein
LTIHQSRGCQWLERLEQKVSSLHASNCAHGSSLTGRVQSVNINAQIDGLGSPNSVADLLDDACSADCINFTSLDDLEAAVTIILIIRWTGEGRADTRVDIAVVSEEAFLGSVEEVCAVIDAGLLRR